MVAERAGESGNGRGGDDLGVAAAGQALRPVRDHRVPQHADFRLSRARPAAITGVSSDPGTCAVSALGRDQPVLDGGRAQHGRLRPVVIGPIVKEDVRIVLRSPHELGDVEVLD